MPGAEPLKQSLAPSICVDCDSLRSALLKPALIRKQEFSPAPALMPAEAGEELHRLLSPGRLQHSALGEDANHLSTILRCERGSRKRFGDLGGQLANDGCGVLINGLAEQHMLRFRNEQWRRINSSDGDPHIFHCAATEQL